MSTKIFVKPALSTIGACIALLGNPRDLHAQSITMGGAARLAAERNPTTVAARARAAQAGAQAMQSRAELLPSISTSMQAGARTLNSASLGIDSPELNPNGSVLGPVHTVDARAHFSQRVFDAPALLRWKAASTGASGERYAAGAAADAAAHRGASAYLGVLRAQARISARVADSALAAELLDIAQQQLEAGIGIALDVTRAEAQLAESKARLIVVRSEEERGRLQLRRELALPTHAPLALAESLSLPAPTETPTGEEEAIRQALGSRGELHAASASIDAARLSTRAARAERLPTIALFADHGTAGRNTDRLLGTYSYGVEFSLPLFDGMRLESRAAEQRARLREAEARLQDTQLGVEMEVRAARLEMLAQREAVAAARVRLRLAEQEVAQARERFRAGVSNNADVITASMALNGARDLVIDALSAYHDARIAFAAAQGTITSIP